MTTPGPVKGALRAVLDRAGLVSGGVVANYIPQLATADPGHFGICLVSPLGHRYDAGDTEVAFTIQSVSKPFVYAVALRDLGLARVRGHIGVEPSGQPFNAISLDGRGRPANPMINAGALVASSLVAAGAHGSRFERILVELSAFAGRPLSVDEEVHASESATGDRNRALAHLTRAGGALVGEVDEVVDTYFRQCSVLVTATDLAVMGATLAGGGCNPVTGERVVDEATARHTLSLMASCGMYDRSGSWILDVGLPAKSGVGGGIVAVAPGQFGVGVFSPPLDEAGNSVRGVEALRILSQEYGLHLLTQPREPAGPVLSLRADRVTGEVRVVVRGELDFAETERVVHDVLAHTTELTPKVTLDLEQVTVVSQVAARLLVAVADHVHQLGRAGKLHDPHLRLARPAERPAGSHPSDDQGTDGA